MTQKTAPAHPRARGRAGQSIAVAEPRQVQPPTASQEHYTLSVCRTQTPAGGLQVLAQDAQAKAIRAALLAECCKAAGDRRGWIYHRRALLAAQAILWAATHPQEAAP